MNRKETGIESAILVALIGTNIGCLNCLFFSPVKKKKARKGLLLAVDLYPPSQWSGKHCQEQKVNALLCAPLSNSALEFRDEGEDLTAQNAQLESFSLSEHGILPPSTGESSICSAVSSCWSPCLLFSASFGQVTTAGAIFHLLWCITKNWPFRIHIVFVFLLWCQLWWMAKLAAVVAELWLHVHPQVRRIMSVVTKWM